jgi:hypothetical protein
MAVFECGLLAVLYRDWRLWLIHILTLVVRRRSHDRDDEALPDPTEPC